MNSRTKTQFKTWQRLPELGTKRAGDCASDQAERLSQSARTAGRRLTAHKEGARSQVLKFIFTTHD